MQPGPSSAQQSSQELVVLAGVVGSGKSTLSQAWQQHLPNWIRVNQDDLGDRRTCEAAVRTALAQGKNVVVDRQNFDAGQRRTWLEIANEFPHVRVGGMVMGTPKDECRVRLLARTNHPTIDNPDLAVSLLEKFSGLWEEPRLEEGFDQLVTLPPLPPAAEIDATLIRSLLDLLHQSPRNPHAASQRTSRPRPAPYMRPDGFVDDGTWRPPGPRQDRAPAPSPYNVSAYRAPPQASPSTWTRGPPPAAYGMYHNPYPYQPPSGDLPRGRISLLTGLLLRLVLLASGEIRAEAVRVITRQEAHHHMAIRRRKEHHTTHDERTNRLRNLDRRRSLGRLRLQQDHYPPQSSHLLHQSAATGNDDVTVISC